MNATKKLALILSLVVLCGGCISSYIVSSDIKKNLTICYDGKAIEANSLSTNGFYQNSSSSSISIPIVFFEDGICVYQVAPPNSMPDGEEGFTSVESYIKRMALVEPDKGINSAYLKGLYETRSDTVVMQLINDVRGGMPTWMGRECQFLILSKQELKFLRLRNLDSEEWIYRDSSEVYEFTPVDTLPSSYIWLKEKNWFWCEGAKENENSAVKEDQN